MVEPQQDGTERTWFKWAGAALVAVAIFASGYKYAAAIYEADIADLQAQHALTTKELTDEYRRKEQDQAKTNMKRLALSLLIFGLMLTGCATKPTVIAPNCPEPAPIPASISQSDSATVSDYSMRVRDWLLKVQNFLKNSQENTMP